MASVEAGAEREGQHRVMECCCVASVEDGAGREGQHRVMECCCVASVEAGVEREGQHRVTECCLSGKYRGWCGERGTALCDGVLL